METMTYTEAVAYIHSLLAFGIKPGLSRIRALLERLGNPQNGLRFLHIAGTNGKGSTATMLSSILREAGYQTGLFTSPYVFSFCERIRINGQEIPEAALAAATARVKPEVEALNRAGIVPTEFEVITAIALWYFAEQHCDYVVLEVGLGGRFDSTNIIPAPAVCVLTSISLDHTQILGSTVAEIAAEKAGIIKENSVCVTTTAQPPEALTVLRETAAKKHAQLTVAAVESAQIVHAAPTGTEFLYDGECYFVPLAGAHQVENAVGVIEAAKRISGVSTEHIRAGIRNTVLCGRMDLRAGTPPMLLDGGHNPECGQALAAYLQAYAPQACTAVVGMMADKDCSAYLHSVLPYCQRVVFTKPSNPRAEEPSVLRGLASDLPVTAEIQPVPKAALALAKQQTPADGLLLICGSFYLLSDLF